MRICKLYLRFIIDAVRWQHLEFLSIGTIEFTVESSMSILKSPTCFSYLTLSTTYFSFWFSTETPLDLLDCGHYQIVHC